jgi:hypothetical protein
MGEEECGPQTAPKFPFRQWGMKPTVSRLQVYNTLRHD